MKVKIFFLALSLLLIQFSCKEKGKDSNSASKDTVIHEEKTVPPPKADEQVMPELKDTGQQYFRVAVWKSGQLQATYEGDWPIGEFSGDYCTLQMPASKRMLKISNFLVLYFRGIATGSFPIVPSGSEKGKPTLIYTPEKDGAYGVGIGANEGTVEITKYSDKSLSGKLNAKGVDENGQPVVIKAEFINIRNHDLGD